MQCFGYCKAAELLSVMSGDYILGPTSFWGQGDWKKGEVKFSAMYFGWLIRRKRSKMNFFQVVLAKIVARKVLFGKMGLYGNEMLHSSQ